jgi:3-oxoacyl-[acyl-carrier protein] reductase
MELVLRDGAFEGETHIVTGAGQGIGNRIAAALAAHGAQVALVDLDAGRLADVRDEIAASGAPKPLAMAANVTSEGDVQRVVADTLAASGCINGVVNVAGITRDARITKKSFEDFQAVIAVHLHGTFLFTREVAVQHWHPLFKGNGNQPLRDGVNRFIVNFSSVSARDGNVGQVDYTAAKGAIESVTKTAAREFGSYGVRVNAIAHGVRDRPPEALRLHDGAGLRRQRRHVPRLTRRSRQSRGCVARSMASSTCAKRCSTNGLNSGWVKT